MTSVVVVSGCEKKQTASQQLDKVQEKSAEVAKDIKEYSYSQRDEFVKIERKHLFSLNRDLDDLAARVERSSVAVKSEAEPRITSLRERTARLNKRLDEAASATESSWDQFKSDVHATYTASTEELNKARQWLSEKIAP